MWHLFTFCGIFVLSVTAPRDVTVLTDSDALTDSSDGHTTARDCLWECLQKPCDCAERRIRRGRAVGTNHFKPFANELFESLMTWRADFAAMHKLDQDHTLFHLLRDLALVNGVLKPQASGIPSAKMSYKFMGRDICKRSFATLLGVSWFPRLSSILGAVMEGLPGPKVDIRYLKEGKGTRGSVLEGEVFSYIQGLWESVAETMPHHAEDNAAVGAAAEEDLDEYADICVRDQVGVCTDDSSRDEERYLPPGTIYECWRQFLAANDGVTCSFRVFWVTWMKHFGHKLSFRTKYMFSVCPVCMKHKMLLRLLANDASKRLKQRLLYDRHLKGQYNDRRWYWFLRAQSRLLTPIIVIILDGMDQAKFMWPRSPIFKSHEFDSFQRPRLHIWGFIVHGYMCGLTISHADTHKGGSTTVEVLSWLLTELVKLRGGGDLSACHIHLQLDNTSSTNKNNTLLLWMALIVTCGIVGTCTANFLRTGHTHEDIDQVFGELAKWVWKHLHSAYTLEEFEESLKEFLKCLRRPHDAIRIVKRFDQVRHWKCYLDMVKKRVTGIGGQGAPHVFSCQRVADLPSGHALRQSGCNDVVLRCRQWMSDVYDTASKHYVTRGDVLKLAGPLPIQLAPKAKINQDYKTMITKYAKLLELPPYNMGSASKALSEWVEGTFDPKPLLDVSACKLLLCARPPAAPMPPLSVVPQVPQPGVMAFEPAPNDVHIAAPVGRRNEDDASPYAQAAFPLAADMVSTYGMGWPEALGMAKRCWERMAPSMGVNAPAVFAADPADEEDEGENVLELVPAG